MKRSLHTFLLVLAGLWGHTAFAQGTSTLDGVVFRDLDGNGTQDPGEEGIPGVLVELRTGITPSSLYLSALTNASGSYSLSGANLPDASDYHLRFWYPRKRSGSPQRALQPPAMPQMAIRVRLALLFPAVRLWMKPLTSGWRLSMRR